MANLWKVKPLSSILAQADGAGEHTTLKRTLGPWALVALGIGAIIGAGIFVRTAAAAGTAAGPAVTLSFVVAGIGCAFAGLCYAELSSMIPVAGSAYTYSYATMGEFIAWIIGWDLVLEYAVGAATVAIAWSEYFNNLLSIYFGFTLPYQFYHSPMQVSPDGVHGLINLPALFIVVVLSLLLIRGTQESSFVNGIIVILKVAIVLLFIGLGWGFINQANYTPYIPENISGSFGEFGWGGVLRGAGIVFFAYIGFDAVSTAAQEAKNPGRDMPIGILGSLVFCTLLYIIFAHVLTGVANYTEFGPNGAGHEASVAYAIRTYMTEYPWLEKLITLAILAGFSSVILVMLLGQSRVFFSMSKDGLLPSVFSDLHTKFRTPYKSNLLFLLFVGFFAAFIPGDIVGDMTSIGTLFAFVLVSIAVIVMRKKNPDAARPFRTPMVPLIPILGAAICLAMMAGLHWHNWLRLIVWMAIGVVIYFAYSAKHSKLNK